MRRLSSRSVAELKMIARDNGIDTDGMLKAQILEAIEESGGNVIRSMNTVPSGTESASATTNANGVLIAPQPEKVKQKREDAYVPEQPKKDLVALHAVRNLSWAGVGKVEKGYNFVTREVADKWLQHKAVREATPEEVAAHYQV